MGKPLIQMSDGEVKPSSQLLDEINKADASKLKDVETKEQDMSRQKDMAMYGVGHFDKTKLKTIETVEKMFFPHKKILKRRRKKRRVCECIKIFHYLLSAFIKNPMYLNSNFGKIFILIKFLC